MCGKLVIYSSAVKHFSRDEKLQHTCSVDYKKVGSGELNSCAESVKCNERLREMPKKNDNKMKRIIEKFVLLNISLLTSISICRKNTFIIRLHSQNLCKSSKIITQLLDKAWSNQSILLSMHTSAIGRSIRKYNCLLQISSINAEVMFIPLNETFKSPSKKHHWLFAAVHPWIPFTAKWKRTKLWTGKSKNGNTWRFYQVACIW